MKLVFAILAASVMNARATLGVIETSETISERGPVSRLIIESSAGNFALNPPPAWSLQLNRREERIVFELEKLGAVLALRFSTNAAPRSQEELQTFVESRWPGAVIVEQYAAFARAGEGKAVECIYRSAAATRYRARLAFLPGERGLVEVTLTGPDDWPSLLHNSWTALLNSLERRKPAHQDAI